MENGADLNSRGHHGRGPLFNAVEFNSFKAVAFLLDAPGAAAAVNAAELSTGRTPLDAAAALSRADLAALLLSRGALPGKLLLPPGGKGGKNCCAVM